MKTNHIVRQLISFVFVLSGLTPAYSATGLQPIQLQTSQTISQPTGTAKSQATDAQPNQLSPTTASTLTTVSEPYAVNDDYVANQNSDVFGAQLFTGSFARQGHTQFNPDYVVAIGDQLQVRLWGAFEIDALYTVDPQGNIFLPQVGPIKVLGVRNGDLQSKVESAIKRVFRANVLSYTSLAAAQPVRVFVSGFVYRPGLYHGTSMDSLLHYLDQAGGIDPERGSFLNVQVKRGSQVRATVSLYEFLLDGRMPQIQLSDGDVIFVTPRQNTVKVSGLAENAKRFEFAGNDQTVADLVHLAKPLATVTHVRVVRNTGTVKNIEYHALESGRGVGLKNGDEIEFTADKKPGTITVRVEGEHHSAQEYVLSYGAKLSDLVNNIQYTSSSDPANLQLFRLSVRDRQKQMLAASLRSLESSVLTARSATNEESRLRKDEAELMLQWVERAKAIEPSGQVMISQAAERGELLLENGDVLRVPRQDRLVLVSGEVNFPNAIAFDPKLDLDDYIKRAGGYSQSANTSRILIAHRDGSFQEASSGGFFSSVGEESIKEGDEILVLPKVQTKSMEVSRGLAQILYQLAISAKVVLDL